MRAVVVYESMFGSTRKVGEAIAEGLSDCAEVSVVSVARADAHTLDGADLVVVGGPTHIHGMSRPSTRKAARGASDKAGSALELEEGADSGPGVREWLGGLGRLRVAGAAAFDTRFQGLPAFTGRASKSIGRLLARHGARIAAPPESFVVDKTGALLDGELKRARSWGEHLTWSDCLQGVVEKRRVG